MEMRIFPLPLYLVLFHRAIKASLVLLMEINVGLHRV